MKIGIPKNIATTFFAILFGAIFIVGVDIFSPELHLLKYPSNALLFIIFLTASSIAALTGISFVAIRKAGFYFLQSLLVGSRIIFIFPLIDARSNWHLWRSWNM
jgi:hypothetical protein